MRSEFARLRMAVATRLPSTSALTMRAELRGAAGYEMTPGGGARGLLNRFALICELPVFAPAALELVTSVCSQRPRTEGR
ncbi:MAG: hypothetical protein HKN10_13455 [Myxococcales bacterium]|nr:hypothetical protein [Myxococcales bacterium]